MSRAESCDRSGMRERPRLGEWAGGNFWFWTTPPQLAEAGR